MAMTRRASRNSMSDSTWTEQLRSKRTSSSRSCKRCSPAFFRCRMACSPPDLQQLQGRYDGGVPGSDAHVQRRGRLAALDRRRRVRAPVCRLHGPCKCPDLAGFQHVCTMRFRGLGHPASPDRDPSRFECVRLRECGV
eukprot:630722-Rhodomonas_salina.1